jgi:hypothetical protein
LEVAARFVDRRRRADFYRQTILERDVLQLRLAAEQDAADLGTIILQGEVAVTGRRTGEARDLAANPRQPEITLDDPARRTDKQRYRHNRVGDYGGERVRRC